MTAASDIADAWCREQWLECANELIRGAAAWAASGFAAVEGGDLLAAGKYCVLATKQIAAARALVEAADSDKGRVFTDGMRDTIQTAASFGFDIPASLMHYVEGAS